MRHCQTQQAFVNKGMGGLLCPRAVRVSGTAETECALGKPSV